MVDVSAARTWGLNHRVLTSVLRDCVGEFEDLGLDAKEFFVLVGIEDWPYPAQLATHLVIPKPTVTGYVKSLESQGFVRREIDRGDLRRHRLVLTSAGVDTLQRALAVLSRVFDGWLARLDAGERADLQRLLEKVLDAPSPGAAAARPALTAQG